MKFINQGINIKLLLIVLIIFVTNCSSNSSVSTTETIAETAIDNTQRLKGTQILKDDLSAISAHIIDTLLLTKQTDSDTIFKVYSLPELNYLGFLGHKGNGPNEFTAPRYSGEYTIENGKIFMWIHDARKFRFRKVDVYASLNKRTAVVEQEIYIHPRHGLTQFLFYMNDSIVIGNTGYESIEKARLRKFNFKQDTILSSSYVLPELKNIDKLPTSMAYSIFFDRLKFSKSRGLLVSAMQKFDRIDFFDMNLNHLKTIHFGDEAMALDMKNSRVKPMYQYYKDLLLTDDKIYGLYCKILLEVDMPSKPSSIRVFDWEGRLLNTVQVADDLMSIAIDEHNGHMYDVDFENEKIIRYDIDGFKPENQEQ
ncbi:BF3164 family lipoprotein [Roseivirga echinicomitans]